MALNLVQHRSGPSIWDRDAANEWDPERWLLAMLAGAFLVAGMRRGSVSGFLLAVGGAGLGWWATTGLDTRQLRRAHMKQVWPRRGETHHLADADPVAEASQESFPASDPPAWTPTTGNL